MARGLTLEQIVTLVRDESSQSSNAAFGQSTADMVRTKIRRTYQRLHADWQWPHLRVVREKAMSPGSRFYSFPTDIDPDRLIDVHTKESAGDVWRPVKYGISVELYNSFDPSEDEREDPVRAWDYYEGDQFEVWPLPSTATTLRFVGFSKAKALTSDGNICDLDGHLIALYVSAEILAKQKSPDAQLKLEQANALYHRLKGNSQRTGSFPIQRKERRWAGIHVRAPGA